MSNNKQEKPNSKGIGKKTAETLSAVVNRKFTEPVTMSRTGDVSFTQVIRIDLDLCESGFGLTVNRIEFDAKVEFPCESEPLQVKIAQAIYEILRDDSRKLCELDSLASLFDSTSKPTKWNELIGHENFETKLNEYRPIASSYDISFTGKAAVIYRSNVGNLVFRPEPLIFNNDRDRIYYRNICVTENFGNRQCTMQNAWHSGRAINKLKNKTPQNQEHKIDLSMVLGVKEYINEDVTSDYTWLLTPIKIDPPVDNDGTGD